MPFLDGLMLLLSSKWFSIPIYFLLTVVLYRLFGLRKLGWIAVASVVLVILTDQGSVFLFKDVFQRLRPCHEPQLESLVRLVTGNCGGKYGFVSSHAANTFGLAAFMFALLRPLSNWFGLLFIWAAIIGVSRVWLGVHYPGDVVAGAFFGLSVGSLMAVMTTRSLADRTRKGAADQTAL
jgi:undecaprenyl-diphosphatase